MPSTTFDDRDLQTWITAVDAAEILAVSRTVVDKLGNDRQLTRRHVPGSIPRYLRRDVEALAEACTIPAVPR